MPRGKPRDYWHHLKSWLAQRDIPDVLLLAYETVARDHPASIRRIAEFLRIPLDNHLLQLTLDRSSLAYMTRNKSKFDDLLMRTRSEEACNLPPGSDSARVLLGLVGSHRVELSDTIILEKERIWREEIIPRPVTRATGRCWPGSPMAYSREGSPCGSEVRIRSPCNRNSRQYHRRLDPGAE